MRKTKIAAAMATMLAFGAGAQAAPIAFLFDSPTGDLGPVHTYTAGAPALSIVASGFGPAGTADLFGKNQGPGEQGVGLTNDSTHDNEITVGSFVQIDVAQLMGRVSTIGASFIFGSTTGGEEYAVYGSNTADSLGTQLATGTDETSHALPDVGTYRYYDFTSLRGNVLLGALAGTTVPEPATLAILGAGLLGLGMTRLRRA